MTQQLCNDQTTEHKENNEEKARQKDNLNHTYFLEVLIRKTKPAKYVHSLQVPYKSGKEKLISKREEFFIKFMTEPIIA